MKIVKVLFIFALVSMIAVSCKETKKEEAQDDSLEMIEEGSDDSGMEASDADASSDAAAATEGDTEGAMEAAEGIEAESKDLESVEVPEGVILEEMADTPVVYPGCSGTNEEIRACTKESFISYLKSKFNQEVASEENLKEGGYEIGVVLHVNKAGRVFSLRVTAPNEALKTEMERVINSTPHVEPATRAGEPVGVSAKFVVDFRVEKY